MEADLALPQKGHFECVLVLKMKSKIAFHPKQVADKTNTDAKCPSKAQSPV
jgi:hypothetical protein